MENKNIGGILLFAGLLLFGWYFLSKKTEPVVDTYLEEEPPTLRLQPRIAIPQPAQETEGHRYRNNETWDIEWNPDGLPAKVTIHRDAVQT